MNWKRFFRPTTARLAVFVALLVLGFLLTEYGCSDMSGPVGQHIDHCGSRFGPLSGPVLWLLLPIIAYVLAAFVTWRKDSSSGRGAV
jgi:hypothetical protein